MSTTTSGDQTDDQVAGAGQAPATGSAKVKEQEPPPPAGGEDDKIIAEITSRAEAVDAEAIAKVREAIPDAAQAQSLQPQLPADVVDAGVVSPQIEADKVVADGATINLPVEETTYKKGLHARVAGVVKDKVVVGVTSLAALAMWVGRLIKMAHKHTMRVVFRSSSASSSAKATDDKKATEDKKEGD